MKPAPPRKPKRLRAVIIYTVPAGDYKSLKDEMVRLELALRRMNHTVKSGKIEFAAWGSGKRGSVVGTVGTRWANKTDIKLNKSIISSDDKNAFSNHKRFIDLSEVNKKK